MGERGPEGRGGHGPKGPEGRGRRGGRMLDHGDLRVLVLHLIVEKPRHGYELIRAIEELTGGAYSPSPGVIYPTLTLLEELGHTSVTEEAGGRKLYSVTEEGKAALANSQPPASLLLARIADHRPREEANPSLNRAVENFRYALRLRLQTGSLSAEQLEVLVTLLDETARKIEKI